MRVLHDLVDYVVNRLKEKMIVCSTSAYVITKVLYPKLQELLDKSEKRVKLLYGKTKAGARQDFVDAFNEGDTLDHSEYSVGIISVLSIELSNYQST